MILRSHDTVKTQSNFAASFCINLGTHLGLTMKWRTLPQIGTALKRALNEESITCRMEKYLSV